MHQKTQENDERVVYTEEAKQKIVDKIIWTTVYCTLISMTIFLIITLWNRFVMNPTVTSLESSTYLISNIPFPGISICNVNKISRRRATQLANDIYSTNTTESEPIDILGHLRLIGALYDYNINPSEMEKAGELQDILYRLNFSIQTLMWKLSTPCEELLRSCRWKGVEMNCSELFEMRMTFEGYCCTFNYVKNTSEVRDHQHTRKRRNKPETGEAGLEKGLSIVVNNDLDDYFYTVMSSLGVNVHVFIPTDFPDKNSGGLIENLVGVSSENFLEVVATTVNSVHDVINYPVVKRQCLFETEMRTQFGVYSQSDCLVDCRVKSIVALCNCLPFNIPIPNDNVCTLTDVLCLHNFKNKWNSLAPVDYEGSDLNQEKDNSLRCDQGCYPSCDGTLYGVGINTVKLYKSTLGNNTSVHLFYGDRYSNLYKQDVLYYWFEILSNFGGIFGLIIGVSMVSFTETLVYLFKFVKIRMYTK